MTIMAARYCMQYCRRFYSKVSSVPQIAIVGSGPAGYYTAQQILKGHSSVMVDIYEKLPVPFGLVRYGIAPDHPEVKNVINTFNTIAKNDRCSFIGNVNVGVDVSVEELRKYYNAVVLAYGADDDKLLSVPGEDLENVMSARAFVGWYNGLPENRNLKVTLDTDCAMVFGHGNVAIDVARILLTPVDLLRKTDITEYALELLSKSRIRKVYLVGRRGPLQVAFTPAELREMIKLPSCRPVFSPEDFKGIENILSEIPRARKRLTELMLKTALNPEPVNSNSETMREFHLKFLRSPLKFIPSADKPAKVESVQIRINRLEAGKEGLVRAIPTEQTETIECGLVLRSIGYKSHRVDSTTPFDEEAGIVPNNLGRVVAQPGLYCSGWVKRGPIGVLGTTMNDAFETGKILVDDLYSGSLSEVVEGREKVLDKLKQKGIRLISFSDWEKIDRIETERGEQLGKCRQKITDCDEMINAVDT